MTRVCSSNKNINEVETVYFVFKYNHIVYKVRCSSINYIEKEQSLKRCIIHTENGKYYIVSSINNITSNMGNNFFRVHQSCAVNMDNIVEVDLINNKIKFKNGDKTSLVSNKIKKELIKILGLME